MLKPVTHCMREIAFVVSLACSDWFLKIFDHKMRTIFWERTEDHNTLTQTQLISLASLY